MHYKGVIMIAVPKKGGKNLDENKIIPYIEPVFRFCCKRLSNRCDAEDLASEIICHILDGMNKYQIESLDAWVWRIAHNRYARFINNRNKNDIMLSCDDELFDVAGYSDVDEESTEELYETVFGICTRYLPSTGIYLWTTISENYPSEVLPKSILSQKPPLNGA